MTDIVPAIVARLQASSNGKFRGDLAYALRAPSGITPKQGLLPVVSFALSWDTDDTFTSDGNNMQLLVTIADHQANTVLPTFAAYQRVKGNAIPATKTAPTYGLHRHILSLPGSTNVPTMMRELGGDTLYDEDPNVIGLVIRYEVGIHKG